MFQVRIHGRAAKVVTGAEMLSVVAPARYAFNSRRGAGDQSFGPVQDLGPVYEE